MISSAYCSHWRWLYTYWQRIKVHTVCKMAATATPLHIFHFTSFNATWTVAIEINTCIPYAIRIDGFRTFVLWLLLLLCPYCRLVPMHNNFHIHLVCYYNYAVQSWFDTIIIIYSVIKYNVSDYIVWIARLFRFLLLRFILALILCKMVLIVR